MSRSHPPDDVVRTATDHLAEWHDIPSLGEDDLAREGEEDERAPIVWRPATRKRGASLTCRRCPEGRDVFFADLYAPVPTPRALAKIRAHVAKHGVKRLRLTSIAYEGNTGKDKKATWLPATPLSGAGFICHAGCPEGMNRIFEPPPHGDARRTTALLREHPELWAKTKHLSWPQRTRYIEAWDRGLLDEQDFDQAARALADEQKKPVERRPRPAERPLQRVFLEAVRAGHRPSDVLEWLFVLQHRNPVRYRCLVGEAVAELADQRQRLEPAEFATLVSVHLGHIEVSDRTLWTYWQRIDKEERAAALAEGETKRPKKLH